MRYTPFAIGILLLMASYLVGAPATQPVGTASLPVLSMKVKLASDTFKADEYPEITVTFTNNTDKPLTIMRPIDGSESGWRVVSYTWATTDAAGKPAEKKGIGRCGNVNPITTEDFIEIPAGKSVTLPRGFLLSPNITVNAKPGDTFKTSLVYAFKKDGQDRGLKLGDDAPGTKALLDKTWESTIASEPVTFQIAP